MSYSQVLSIRERIEEQICADVATVVGVSRVLRFDGRGITALDGDAFVFTDGDQKISDAMGGPGIVERRLSVLVAVCIRQDESDAQYTAYRWNALQAALETVLAANPYVNETIGQTTTRLAVNSAVTDIVEIPRDEGQPEWYAMVRVSVDYQHDFTSPNTGPGITALTATSLPTYAIVPNASAPLPTYAHWVNATLVIVQFDRDILATASLPFVIHHAGFQKIGEIISPAMACGELLLLSLSDDTTAPAADEWITFTATPAGAVRGIDGTAVAAFTEFPLT